MEWILRRKINRFSFFFFTNFEFGRNDWSPLEEISNFIFFFFAFIQPNAPGISFIYLRKTIHSTPELILIKIRWDFFFHIKIQSFSHKFAAVRLCRRVSFTLTKFPIQNSHANPCTHARSLWLPVTSREKYFKHLENFRSTWLNKSFGAARALIAQQMPSVNFSYAVMHGLSVSRCWCAVVCACMFFASTFHMIYGIVYMRSRGRFQKPFNM